jgi:hypothetical protein
MRCALCSIFQPLFLLGLTLSIGLGYFLFVVRRTRPLVINGQAASRLQTLCAFVAISVLLFGWTGGLPALGFCAASVLLCILHALVRMRSVRAKGTTFVRGLTGDADDPVTSSLGSYLEEDVRTAQTHTRALTRASTCTVIFTCRVVFVRWCAVRWRVCVQTPNAADEEDPSKGGGAGAGGAADSDDLADQQAKFRAAFFNERRQKARGARE